jgi:hypothetical protein
MRIERVGMTTPRPMPDAEEMIAAIDWAAKFVRELMTDWPDWVYEFSEDFDPNGDNQFASQRRRSDDPVYNPELDKVRGRAITSMRWRLEPDEALILEWDHDDKFWMLTNMGLFQNSMDYLYRPVSYSPARTRSTATARCASLSLTRTRASTTGWTRRASPSATSARATISPAKGRTIAPRS